MPENKENKDQRRKQIWIPGNLHADLAEYQARETLRLGAALRPQLGELLEKAWAVYRGRPEPEFTPAPEDEAITMCRDILSGDKELEAQLRGFLRAIHGVLKLRRSGQ